MAASSSRKPQLAHRFAGQRRDDPESLCRVVQGEADHEHAGERELARGRRLTDGESFGEVVQADSDGDEERQPARRDVGRRRAPHPAHFEQRDTEQPDDEAHHEKAAIHPEGWRERALGQSHVDRVPGVREHVPDQEDQHADRNGVEQNPQARAGFRSRAIGNPRTIVAPAMNPKSRTVVDTRFLW
jgi:hypothetical protein